MANVMIVDDSMLIRNKLKALLKRHGHQVVAEAENGVQAVRRFREYHPDVLTMDITMPEMDGITALKKILEIDGDAKVIMLSAMSQKLLVLNALKMGAKHFLVKPIDEVRFEQVIEEVIAWRTADSGKDSDEAAGPIEKGQEKSDHDETPENKSITFENINGIIVVKIKKEPSEEETQTFMLTMKGILNIKHMQAMFDFEEVNTLSEDFCKRIDAILGGISEAEGKYMLSSMNKTLGTCLQKFSLQHLNVSHKSDHR